MDKRKKRTSINQYLMYIELLEKDAIFRTGTAPREAEPNYINNKWRDLAGRLNTCPNGPQLSPEEWKKRLNDWKNSTRCKYRRSISGEKDISMSPLEVKALSLFGKTPVLLRSAQTLEFKSDSKALYEAEKKHQEAASKAKNDKKLQSTRSMDEEIEGIFIDDDEYNEDESVEEIDVKNAELQLVEAIVNSTPKSKRRRTVDVAAIESKPTSARQVIATAVHTSAASADSSNNISAAEVEQQPQVESESGNQQNNISLDTSGIEHQLKRIADIKAAKLQFEIAKYKYNNPGFEYTFDPL